MTADTIPQATLKSNLRLWAARVAVGLVLAANLSAALPFMIAPQRFAGAFELSDVVGEVMVRSIGLLFVMWVIPYLPALLHPGRYRAFFPVIVAQQLIGLTGESWMWLTLPAGHTALRATGTRFIAFDAAGLVLLLAGWWLSRSIAGEPPVS